MELVPAIGVGTSEEVSTILAMSYAELRAIVVASIVRNTNDKTKMTSLSVEIPVGLLKGGEPNSGNSIQIRGTSITHKRNIERQGSRGLSCAFCLSCSVPSSPFVLTLQYI